MQRKTGQRRAIRLALEQADRPLNAQEVLDCAQLQVPKLGIATVYRNLKALVETGWLLAVELPGEPARYEVRGGAHHHHFRCDSCGRVFDIPGCPDDIEATTPEGFRVDRHEITLYGVCAHCP